MLPRISSPSFDGHLRYPSDGDSVLGKRARDTDAVGSCDVTPERSSKCAKGFSSPVGSPEHQAALYDLLVGRASPLALDKKTKVKGSAVATVAPRDSTPSPLFRVVKISAGDAAEHPVDLVSEEEEDELFDADENADENADEIKNKNKNEGENTITKLRRIFEADEAFSKEIEKDMADPEYDENGNLVHDSDELARELASFMKKKCYTIKELTHLANEQAKTGAVDPELVEFMTKTPVQSDYESEDESEGETIFWYYAE